MKKPLKAVVIFFAVILVLLLTKNFIAEIAVERGVELATGLKLRVSGLHIGVFKSRININDLKLYNPRGFEDKIMVNLPNVYVDYNLPSIIKGKIHLNYVKLNLKEFMVVKNKEGQVNLDALKPVKEQKKEQKEGKDSPKQKTKAPDVRIDNLELILGKVVYKDYSKGDKPSVKEFNINLEERYNNISNLNAVVSIIVVKVLTNTALSGIASIDIKGLSGTVSGALSKTGKAATDAASKATKTVTDAAGKLKESFKIPFGGDKE